MRGTQKSGRWMASLARQAGLDRSPLRRGSDRVEAWIRIALVLAFLIAAPLAGGGAAHWAEAVAPSAAHARLAGEHRVTATLLHDVPNSSDYLAPVSLGWVKARWGISENNRKARFYELTDSGRARIPQERAEWGRTVALMERFLRTEG